MKILALDSTAVTASAAVLSDGRVLADFTADNGLTHSELLLPMAEAVLHAARMQIEDVDLFACTVGPGSFTGVRIGVATVKGLAFGTGKMCAAVSTLEALAEGLTPLDGIYCPVMDARRGQVYNALFEYRGGTLKRLTADRAVSLTALSQELKEKYPDAPIYLAGDGYDLAYGTLTDLGVTLCVTPQNLRRQSAACVARCAHRLAEGGNTVSSAALLPTYLRLPQAERERLERENASQATQEK